MRIAPPDGGAAVAIATRLIGRAPDQTGFVTDDVRAAATTCAEVFGMRPWAGFEYTSETFAYRRYLGRPGDFTTASVVWGAGRFSFVEPVSGDGCFAAALSARGPSLHHVGYFVDDVEHIGGMLHAAGGRELMTAGGHGLDGDGALAFWSMPDTECVVELIVRPRRRRPADFTVG